MTISFPEKIRSLQKVRRGFNAFKLDLSSCDVLFSYYESGKEISDHSHHTENIGVIIKGEMNLFINGVCNKYRKGDWYHIPKHVVHAASFEEDTESIELWFEI